MVDWRLGARRSLLVVVGVWLSSCEPGDPLESGGTPVAWVDEEPVVLEELRDRDSAQTPEQRRVVVDRAVDDLLAAREARRRGLGFTEDVVGKIVAIRRAADLQERAVLRRALRDTVTWDAEVTDEEVRDYFEARRDSFAGRRVALRVIGFESEERARSAEAALSRTPALLPEGRLVELTAVRALPGPLRAAARGLASVGDHRVVSDEASWLLVVLVDERRDPVAFEDVREKLVERVRLRNERERFDAEIERLRAGAEIRIEQGVLDSDSTWGRAR